MYNKNNFSGNCIGRFLLIALLPTLFILFLAANLFGIVDFLHIHMHTFYIASIIYLIFLLFIPHNAFIVACKIKNNFSVTQNELEKSLGKSTLTVDGRTKSVLSVRDFLTDYFSNIRNDNFAKVATSTFPMLGILGTFIAIAISMPDFTASSTKVLDTEISQLLAGVGTAFYASIFGIFLSLLWTFFERLGLTKIEKTTLSLEDLYANTIWSKKELLAFKYNQKALMENEFINTLKSTFNLDFIKNINREHLESYEKIITMTNASLDKLDVSLKNSAQQLQESLLNINNAKEILDVKSTLSDDIAEFNRSAKELHNLLVQFDNGLDSALKSIDSELASAVNHIEDMVAIVQSKES